MKTIINDQMKFVVAKLSGIPSRLCGIFILLGLSITPAFAIGLGAAQLKSALGQPLNLLIPVISATPAELDSGCFALVATGRDDSGLPTILKAKLMVQRRDDDTAFLRLTTNYIVNDPVVAFAIESRCTGVVKREYMVLLDVGSPVDTPVVQSVELTNAAIKSPIASPVHPIHSARVKSEGRTRPASHYVSSMRTEIATATPELKLSSDLQWLPGQHPLTAEQLSDLKRMRSKLSIDAGGDTGTVDNLQDDIVATQKQLAQAKQELAQLRSQIVQAHVASERAKTPSAPKQATVIPASSSSLFVVWMLVAGVVILLLVYVFMFRRRRQLPDFDQAIALPEPVVSTVSHSTVAVGDDVDEDMHIAVRDDFLMEDLPGKSMSVGKSNMEKMTSDSLSVSNLMRVTEEAEVFLELGYPDRAIKVLTDDIEAHPRNRPSVWLMLLGIYRQQDNRQAFDEALVAFNAGFNLVSPTWDDILLPEQEGEGLLTMPHVLTKVIALWPSHECHDYLSELLYDDRNGTRQGFRLDVYRDIIWLKEVWAVLSQPESQIAEDVAANDMLDWDL
ncbi:type IV pilus assembly protein FimV [Sulfuriferula nivalis]|uniref:FimV N-terminal domain-containing protein n=1 Tax=Sulfuriferula nivalis TaxID=2675298 RepID=A0A809RJW7_9PROT|nr:hypothetical protein [Sulfuriferula nivalis]BBP01876.1 hypothetical protein SFSGTM_25840 [Sulfuriferula nivalis]